MCDNIEIIEKYNNFRYPPIFNQNNKNRYFTLITLTF